MTDSLKEAALREMVVTGTRPMRIVAVLYRDPGLAGGAPSVASVLTAPTGGWQDAAQMNATTPISNLGLCCSCARPGRRCV
jgi:hypothetical protein